MLCGQALHLFAECLHKYFSDLAFSKTAALPTAPFSDCSPAPASSHPSDTPSDMPRVAIIGTAGRKGPPLSLSLFHAMFDEAVSVITKTWGLSWHNVDLISGGAAWAGMCFHYIACSLLLIILTAYAVCRSCCGGAVPLSA